MGVQTGESTKGNIVALNMWLWLFCHAGLEVFVASSPDDELNRYVFPLAILVVKGVHRVLASISGSP